jgi:cell division protein FtsB
MNRRRHANIVPVAALVRWVVVAFFLGTAGLSYVYFKNQMQTTGNEIRSLESQLASLTTQDDTVRAQIDRLSSHSYLQRRLAEGFIQLTPITDDCIVRVHPGSRTAAAATDGIDDVQPVSNRVVAQ